MILDSFINKIIGSLLYEIFLVIPYSLKSATTRYLNAHLQFMLNF